MNRRTSLLGGSLSFQIRPTRPRHCGLTLLLPQFAFLQREADHLSKMVYQYRTDQWPEWFMRVARKSMKANF